MDFIYLFNICTDYFESIIFKINISTFISHHSNGHFKALWGCFKSFKYFVCSIEDIHFEIQLRWASSQRLLSAFEQAYLYFDVSQRLPHALSNQLRSHCVYICHSIWTFPVSKIFVVPCFFINYSLFTTQCIYQRAVRAFIRIES